MKITLENRKANFTLSACRPSSTESPLLRPRVSAYTTSAGRSGVNFGSDMMPFPETIDRNIFGAWLSGFVAGEGTFILSMRKKAPRASFAIVLRCDDAEILHLIQSYWQCGSIYTIRRKKNAHLHKPEVKIEVFRHDQLENVLIPHFERFPLFAKKRRDFEIWKEGVRMVNIVNRRKRHKTGVSGRWGRSQKWLANEIEQFRFVHDEIRRIRKVNHADIPQIPIQEEAGVFLF